MTREPRFDEEIHGRLRLQICAALIPVRWAELAVLRETLGISDSVLSKHLARLEAVGYVTVSRGSRGDGRRKTAQLTASGRDAYERHLAALRGIVGSLESRRRSAPSDDGAGR